MARNVSSKTIDTSTFAEDSGVQLSEDERAELDTCERLIADPQLGQGAALRTVRDRRLYRASHDTFEQYCLDRWQMSKSQANRLIAAADVLRNLAPIGVTALPEAHARELVHLSKEDQQVVVRFVKGMSQGGKVTAEHLRSVVTVVREVLEARALDDGTGAMVAWDELSPEQKAALIQVTVDEETYERNQRQREHIKRGISSRESSAPPPAALIAAARAVLGSIDVDPASTKALNDAVGADVFFEAPSDGLINEWPGRVFLHPSRESAPAFVGRLLEQYRSQITNAAVVLLGTRLGNDWSEPLFDHLVCVPTQQAGAGVWPCTVVYLGRDEGQFIDAFRLYGPIESYWDRRRANSVSQATAACS